MDGFLTDAFFYAKSTIALLTWYMDLRLMAYYIIMYICELDRIIIQFILFQY